MQLDLLGKIFKYTFLFLILTELLSLLAHIVPTLQGALFLIIIAITLGLSLFKLEYGLYILLAELFIGGKGYLFVLNFEEGNLSIRIALFLTIILAWLIKKVQAKQLPEIKNLAPFYLLFIAITIGLINGWYNNELSKLFFDFNAWIYFALAPVLIDILKNKKIVNNIIQVLTASTSYLALKTIGVLILFAHNITGQGGIFYQWLRDSGVGEITYVSGTIFRVFMQSQLYLIIGFFIILILMLIKQNQWNHKIIVAAGTYLYLTSFALIISQSRSYWVGLLVGIFALLILAFYYLKINLKKLTLILLILVGFAWSQIFLLQLVTFNFEGNVISQRFSNLEKEAAGLSRINQLSPLTTAILEKPITGHGFGKELTYVSTDPRVVEKYPGGIYTTYAFEWGYLDIWLKLGLIGLTAYFILISTMILGVIKNPQPLQLGMLVGLFAILATNVFSPYLNHPLGIGYIILMTSIINIKE